MSADSNYPATDTRSYGPPSGVAPADNKRLSKRGRRPDIVENDEYAAFLRRAIRAYAKRVGSGDIEAVAEMAGLADELNEATRQAMAGLREFGYSWTDIAARLGVTRQGARQRWMLPDEAAAAS